MAVNAAEHLAQAERTLAFATEQADDGYLQEEGNLLTRALVHAVAAVAIELGVPPTPAPAGGGAGG